MPGLHLHRLLFPRHRLLDLQRQPRIHFLMVSIVEIFVAFDLIVLFSMFSIFKQCCWKRCALGRFGLIIRMWQREGRETKQHLQQLLLIFFRLPVRHPENEPSRIFLSIYLRWVLNGVSVTLMCVTGEFLCMRTELKAIPVSMAATANSAKADL